MALLKTLSWIPPWFWITLMVLLGLYCLGTWNFNYFKRHGVPQVRPVLPFLGNIAPLLFGWTSPTEHLSDMYYMLADNRYGGFFGFSTPALLVRDPELIRDMCVKHFEYFTDRRTLLTESVDSIAGRNLSSLEGDIWNRMRLIINSVLTPKRAKDMYPKMYARIQHLCHFLEFSYQCASSNISEVKIEKVTDGEDQLLEVEMRDIATRICHDIMSMVTLGSQYNSFLSPKNESFRLTQKISNFEGAGALVLLGYLLSPSLMKMLKIPMIPPEIMKFFSAFVRDNKCETNGDDILHILKDIWKAHPDLDDDDLAAQLMLMMLAGVETVSTLVCFATHFIAKHSNVQRRLRQEISSVQLEDGLIPYEELHKMRYLDMVISETLRLHPPAEVLDRKCVKSYAVAGSTPTYILQEGDGIVIPVSCIHRDAKHFPAPHQFRPERFDENRKEIKPFTYLPFGAGPRNCPGARFAMTISKSLLVHFLRKFQLFTVDRTPVELCQVKLCFNKRVEGGFWLGLKPFKS